jgi:hypothetical protein
LSLSITLCRLLQQIAVQTTLSPLQPRMLSVASAPSATPRSPAKPCPSIFEPGTYKEEGTFGGNCTARPAALARHSCAARLERQFARIVQLLLLHNGTQDTRGSTCRVPERVRGSSGISSQNGKRSPNWAFVGKTPPARLPLLPAGSRLLAAACCACPAFCMAPWMPRDGHPCGADGQILGGGASEPRGECKWTCMQCLHLFAVTVAACRPLEGCQGSRA